MDAVASTRRVIAGKYRIERVLAQGGMGVVLLATHCDLEEIVAVKLLLPEIVGNAEVVARFIREARAAARIKNEHVVRVFDVGTTDTGEVYMAMEYLEGTDLQEAIRTRGPLPSVEAVEYVLQAAAGLFEAHRQGIIHRDIKPANLFLVRRSDGSNLVKLLDFGISKFSASPNELSVTHTLAVMGSPLYMSPEQLRSSRAVDERADIWSLGVVLFEALTGIVPFTGETFPEICAQVLMQPPAPLPETLPAELSAVILKCLEKSADDRFATVGELAAALRPFSTLEGQLISDRIVRTAGANPLPPREAFTQPEQAAGAPLAPTPSIESTPSRPVHHPGVLYAATSATFTSTRRFRIPGGRRLHIGVAAAFGGSILLAALVLGLRDTTPDMAPAPNTLPSEASAARPRGPSTLNTPSTITVEPLTPEASLPAAAKAVSVEPVAKSKTPQPAPSTLGKKPVTAKVTPRTTPVASTVPVPSPKATTLSPRPTLKKPVTGAFGGRD